MAAAGLGLTVDAVDNHVLSDRLHVDAYRPTSPAIRTISADIATYWPQPKCRFYDYVLMLAGIASPVHYRRLPFETFDVSVDGTRNMLDLAHAHVATMLFASSSEVYGTPQVIPTPEEASTLAPIRGERACYDVGKMAAETLCDMYQRCYKIFRAISVRLFNAYGAGLAAGDYRVLSTFAGQMARGERLRVYGHGAQTRTFTYVTDTVVGMLMALLRGTQDVYNIGQPTPEITILELARLVERVTGRGWEPEIVVPPDTYVNEPRRRCPDIARARADLGFQPMVGLEEGLGRFFGWAGPAYRAGGLR